MITRWAAPALVPGCAGATSGQTYHRIDNTPDTADTTEMTTTTDTPDILPGFQQMLRHMAEPGGKVSCGAGRVPAGVADMANSGLIKLSETTAEKVSFVLTERGRRYVEGLEA